MSEMTSALKEQYLIAVKVAGLGLGRVDYIDDTITLDARAAALFDLPAEEASPRGDLHARIHPEDRAKIDYQVDILLDPDKDDFIDVQHRVLHGNGDVVWVSARKQVSFEDGPDGQRPVRGLVAIMDISEHKAALAHNTFLMRELTHRSRNLLSVVQGLVRRTLRSGPSETFEERLLQRLEGLARNSDALSEDAWRHADLKQLAIAQLSGFVDPHGSRLRLEGGSAKLDAAQAQAIGMAFHELATNAVKYGALSSSDGQIILNAGPSEDDEATFEVTWTEVGGPSVTAPSHAGFGTTVLTDLVAGAVNGSVDVSYPARGLVWRLRMPNRDLS
ncbi:HWE histidine kinase domain-containing protein [Hasllibacter sp. MH4015]|uniref:HWE histidine kinase domain-containing protein n=1 Tax=Hasllibacter sp. MH4015 TaxID=2854029 RepID=UPI001CD6D0F0|nr:HWE histidine kinase domain-containing protein [Hasllibacter sp. MH4015]